MFDPDPIAELSVLLVVIPLVLIVYTVGFVIGTAWSAGGQLIFIFGLSGGLAVTGLVLAAAGNAAVNEGASLGMMLRALLLQDLSDKYRQSFGAPLWWGVATLAGTAALFALLASGFGVLFGIAQARRSQQTADSN